MSDPLLLKVMIHDPTRLEDAGDHPLENAERAIDSFGKLQGDEIIDVAAAAAEIQDGTMAVRIEACLKLTDKGLVPCPDSRWQGRRELEHMKNVMNTIDVGQPAVLVCTVQYRVISRLARHLPSAWGASKRDQTY
jgi:hypothetical protein